MLSRGNLSPVQTSSRSLILDVGEDRLVLTARPSLFHLDVFHPFLIDQESSVAQYNNSTQVQNTHVLHNTPHNNYVHITNNTTKTDILTHIHTCLNLDIMCSCFLFTDPYSHHACCVFMKLQGLFFFFCPKML